MNIPDVPARLAQAYALSPGDTGLALGFTNYIIGEGRTVDALSEENGAPKVVIAGLMVGLALQILRVAVPKLNENIDLTRALSIEPERN